MLRERCGDNRRTHDGRSYTFTIVNPPQYSVSQIMRYLKRKSDMMIFERHTNLKYKYGDRHFWAEG